MAFGMGWLGGQVRNLADSLVRRKQRSATRAFIAGLKKDVRQAFEMSRDPVTGQAWHPVARPGKPLILTGLLMRSTLAAVDAAKPWGGGLRVQVSEPFYAPYHQNGTRTIHRRRFLGASQETREKALKWYAADLVDLMVGK
jgi:phage gpG-like protein